MIPHLVVRRALLLQGPMSPFFMRLADELRQQGAEHVLKVNFNSGDALFNRGPDTLSYRGTPEGWPAFVEQLIRDQRFDAVFVFGDGRRHHREARAVCEALGVDFYVFEEGYLRPNLITLERHGVNGNSRMPRDPAFFRAEGKGLPRLPPAEAPERPFRITGWLSTLYSLAMTFADPLRYPHYVHHRPLNAFAEAYRWVLSGARKLYYRGETERYLPRLTGELSGRFFVVALQVHCDYQLCHSPFDDVRDFIRHVFESFARAASPTDHLVVKHHPLDRAYRDYADYLRELCVELGLEGRVIYVHDVHLPTLLKHAKGSVMINSTVGLSSVHHGTPVKVLGFAIYDMEGLTAQMPLDEFWSAPGRVDAELYGAFRRWLLHHNQANGNFYRPLPGAKGPTGVRWYAMEGLKPAAGHGATPDEAEAR